MTTTPAPTDLDASVPTLDVPDLMPVVEAELRAALAAAREELAKTRAELAKAQQMEAMAGRHAQQRDADLKDAEVTIQRLKTRLAEGDARWSRHMADEHPIEVEANHATTAEPADWDDVQLPSQGRVVGHGVLTVTRTAEPAAEPKAPFALEVPPGCPRDCKAWCKAYEEGVPCPQDAEPAAS